MEELNIRLKAQRVRAGKTQQEMAAVLSVSLEHYANIENGRRSISVQYLGKLCEYYNVSADYFFGFDDYPFPLGENLPDDSVNPKFYAMTAEERRRVNETIDVWYRGED